jgi:DNA-binding NarL/FixJ family response regulator
MQAIRQEAYRDSITDASCSCSEQSMRAGANASTGLELSRGEARPPQAIAYWNRTDLLRIGLVDRHLLTRECITGFLRQLGIEVTSFTSCEECLKSTEYPHIILYHVRHLESENIASQMPEQLDLLLQIAPVIILSAADHHELMVEALEKGARGFVPTGTTTPEQVIEISRLVRAGGIFVPASSLAPKGANGSGLVRKATATCQFTTREWAVFECLAAGKSNKIIAYELGISESTVKTRLNSMMAKLKAKNRAELICRAYDLANIRPQ